MGTWKKHLHSDTLLPSGLTGRLKGDLPLLVRQAHTMHPSQQLQGGHARPTVAYCSINNPDRTDGGKLNIQTNCLPTYAVKVNCERGWTHLPLMQKNFFLATFVFQVELTCVRFTYIHTLTYFIIYGSPPHFLNIPEIRFKNTYKYSNSSSNMYCSFGRSIYVTRMTDSMVSWHFFHKYIFCNNF